VNQVPNPGGLRTAATFAAIGVLGIAPLLVAVGATWLGKRLGCQVDEAAIHSCPVAGIDVGGALHTLHGFGWLSLVSLPASGFGLIAFTVAIVVRRRR